MVRYILAAAFFLLVGCPGPGDRMVSRVSTTAIIRDSLICVLSPMKVGEVITAIQIYSSAGDKLIKTFNDHPIYIPHGDCLPLFNYTFLPGRKYSLAYDVKSSEQNSHLITSEFSTVSVVHRP